MDRSPDRVFVLSQAVVSIGQVVADFPFALQVLQPRGQSQVLLVVGQSLSVLSPPAVEVPQVCCRAKSEVLAHLLRNSFI